MYIYMCVHVYVYIWLCNSVHVYVCVCVVCVHVDDVYVQLLAHVYVYMLYMQILANVFLNKRVLVRQPNAPCELGMPRLVFLLVSC